MRHRRAVLLLILAASQSVAAEDLPRGVAVAPHPMAATVAQQVLHAGGTATDAAIAAQMMLTVVAPQASGLGGGSMLLHFDGATHEITNWDGREVAPAGATPELFTPPNGAALPVTGGRSVGVPGTVRMLEGLYREHGHLPWADLLAPAIRAAEAGVPISPALAEAISTHADRLRRQPAAKALFFAADGSPLAVGALLMNPALGATLRAIATGGANALLHGPIAADIATTVRTDTEPGLLTTDDLIAYTAHKRVPVCLPYRDRTVCVAAPPAAGPQVLEALGLLQPFRPRCLGSRGARRRPSPHRGRATRSGRSRALFGRPGFRTYPVAGPVGLRLPDGAGSTDRFRPCDGSTPAREPGLVCARCPAAKRSTPRRSWHQHDCGGRCRGKCDLPEQFSGRCVWLLPCRARFSPQRGDGGLRQAAR